MIIGVHIYEMISERTNHISVLLLFIFLATSLFGEVAPLLFSNNNSEVTIEKSCRRNNDSKDQSKTNTSITTDSKETISKVVAKIPCVPVNHQFQEAFSTILNSIKIVFAEHHTPDKHVYIKAIEIPPAPLI